jgi:hypothetical protein
MKRSRLPDFETCSVALFASLARGRQPLAGPAEPNGKRRRRPQSESHRSGHPAAAAAAPALPQRLDRPEEGSPRDGSISSAGFDEALK